MNIPKVFISYSHDTLEHKKWILELSIRLRNHGIDAILDQWELSAGSDIPHYMEVNLADADYIIMVCTTNYVEKANKGTGGVGYEKMIITSTLMKSIKETKVIPLIRQSGLKVVPTFLTTKLYIDFSNDSEFEIMYDNLIRTIHKSPIFDKPPIGNNPFAGLSTLPMLPKNDPIKDVMLYFISQYENENMGLFFNEVVAKFKISRLMVQYLLTSMENQGLIIHRKPLQKQDYYELSEKGINYAVDQGLIK